MMHILIMISSLLAYGVLFSGEWTGPLSAQLGEQEKEVLEVLPKSVETRITSHNQSQEVPVGNLTIFGTSSDDASTNCEVYVDKNDFEPFQKTIAIGAGGHNDYSNWTFTYTPQYAVVTIGNTNELTAKLSCLNSPNNLTSFYTVNVTGIPLGEQSQGTNTTSATGISNITTTPLVTSPTIPIEALAEDQDSDGDKDSVEQDNDGGNNGGGSNDGNNDDNNDDEGDKDDGDDDADRKKPEPIDEREENGSGEEDFSNEGEESPIG